MATYPLEGTVQRYPLSGVSRRYPLAGTAQHYPLDGSTQGGGSIGVNVLQLNDETLQLNGQDLTLGA